MRKTAGGGGEQAGVSDSSRGDVEVETDGGEIEADYC